MGTPPFPRTPLFPRTPPFPGPTLGEMLGVDDRIVHRYIDGAWLHNPPDRNADPNQEFLKRLRAAFTELRDTRRQRGRSADLNLAAAEHYLFARQAVANADVSAAQMRAMVHGYEWTKTVLEGLGLDWLMRTTSEPTARASSDVMRWGLKGVDDGEHDRGRYNQGKAPPAFNRGIYDFY
ncbi:MAG TPA: hypothetical protein VJR58_02900 [Vineibacter sp.]|nr:hypothetical protein [Vineibacter sp.]